MEKGIWLPLLPVAGTNRIHGRKRKMESPSKGDGNDRKTGEEREREREKFLGRGERGLTSKRERAKRERFVC